MAGMDLGTASGYVHHQLHQQQESDQDDNTNNNRNQFNHHHDETGGHQDGRGDIAARRPRGRPPCSKNKPKPPIIITRESPNTVRANILEVSNGCDVFDCVATYARRRQHGICILSGSGTVTNVSLRQPATAGSIVTLQGRFDILSLSGSFLPPPAPLGATSFTIFLVGSQGQVVGGSVVGALIAAGTVTVIAASFTKVAYERLPLDEEDNLQIQPPVSQSSGGGGSGGGGGVNNPFPDQSSALPLFNLPLNMANNVQLPIDDGLDGLHTDRA